MNTPTTIAESKVSAADYAKLLLKYVQPQKGKAIWLTALLFTSIGMQLISPQLLRSFIDGAQAGVPVEQLLWLAVWFLVVGLVNQLLSAWATYVGADLGWSATNLLRADLANHLLRLDMTFHNDRTPGEMVERIDGDVTALANFFSRFLVRVAGSLILMVGTLVLLYREDWRVGVAITLYAIVALFVLGRTRNIAIASTSEEREGSAKMFGFIEERLNGLDDIRANGGSLYAMSRFYDVTRTWFHNSHRAWVRRSMVWTTAMSVFTLGTVLAFGMGIWLFLAGVITLGTIYLIYQYTDNLIAPLEQITQEMQELQKAGASVSRVSKLMALQPSLHDGEGAILSKGAIAIDFDHVDFAYAGQDKLLTDVNVTIPAGRVVGLLGRTGSGKSTLTRLLFRLYDPVKGGIRLNGVDMRTMRMSDLRRRVSMVTQDVQLFNGSVRDNLTFFNADIPDVKILKTIDELGLNDWFKLFPEGLNTHLPSGGGGLSAGEGQLLALIRAFLQDPSLIVLDEPSSRLDPATERLLERAVARLLQGRTAIIIAHRLATVERADDIMILDAGRVLEYGNRAALASNPSSRFYKLLRTNLADVTT